MMALNPLREFNPIPRFVRQWVQGLTGRRLQQMGLTYHDVIAESPVLLTAISRLPADVQEARIRRIRRAFDMSMKKQYLPESEWEDPWREYDMMESLLQEAQREYDERRFLSDEPWFTNIGMQAWYPYELDSAWFWKDSAVDAKPEPKKLH